MFQIYKTVILKEEISQISEVDIWWWKQFWVKKVFFSFFSPHFPECEQRHRGAAAGDQHGPGRGRTRRQPAPRGWAVGVPGGGDVAKRCITKGAEYDAICARTLPAAISERLVFALGSLCVCVRAATHSQLCWSFAYSVFSAPPPPLLVHTLRCNVEVKGVV